VRRRKKGKGCTDGNGDDVLETGEGDGVDGLAVVEVEEDGLELLVERVESKSLLRSESRVHAGLLLLRSEGCAGRKG